MHILHRSTHPLAWTKNGPASIKPPWRRPVTSSEADSEGDVSRDEQNDAEGNGNADRKRPALVSGYAVWGRPLLQRSAVSRKPRLAVRLRCRGTVRRRRNRRVLLAQSG